MDKYAILCLFTLVILSIWHSIIGSLIFMNTPDFRITPTSEYVQLDRYVLYLAVGIYLIIHLILFIWLYCVPLKIRRELQRKDRQYGEKISRESQLLKMKKSDYIPISIQS